MQDPVGRSPVGKRISGVGKRYISAISIHMADRTAKGIDPEADRIPFLRKGDPLGEVLEIRYGLDPCDGGDPYLRERTSPWRPIG